MKILLVAATAAEAAHIFAESGAPPKGDRGLRRFEYAGQEVSLLITGVGMVNTAYALGRYFARYETDLAINFGVAGTFDPEIELGTVVEVREEIFGEMGAENGGEFLGMKELGFVNFSVGKKQFYNRIKNPTVPETSLRDVTGLTVNRVHGNEASIAAIKQLWKPEVETMEGAAFFQACRMQKVDFYELRGISNRVERRNRESWKLQPAIENVQKAVLKFIEQL